MHARVSLGVVVFVLFAAAGVSRGDEAECRALVEKSIQAIGGREKLEKFKAGTWSEKGTFYGMGAGLPYTGKYAVQWPHQFRMEIEGVFTILLNGDKGWTIAGGNTMEMPEQQLRAQKDGHYHGWVTTLVPLKDKEFKLSSLGESKVGERTAVGVKVSRKDRHEVRLFFDKETHLLLKSETRGLDLQGAKEVDSEVLYREYKDFAGIKSPTKVNMKQDGKPFVDAEIHDMKFAEKLDDNVFKP